MQQLRLSHSELDFWIDVRLRDWDGKWLAVADVADEPDIGTSEDPRKALRGALMALGPRLAGQLADRANLSDPTR